MTDIAPIARPNPPSTDAISRTTLSAAAAATGTTRRSDQVELSTHAQLMSRLQNLPIRGDLVGAVKNQIAQGTYDSPEKIEAVLNSANFAEDMQE